MFDLGPSPFDVRFTAFRIPVRVHWTFWVLMALLGWNPDQLDKTFIFVMCGFVSVLVHEFGHGLTAEAFGWPTHIILFVNGGVAVSNRVGPFSPWRNFFVSLMGPGAGFLLLLIVVAVHIALILNDVVLSERTAYFLTSMEQINLIWSILNLFPVLPLDGGHILLSFLQGIRLPAATHIVLFVGAVLSGAGAFYLLRSGGMQMFGAFLLLFCVQNAMALSQTWQRR